VARVKDLEEKIEKGVVQAVPNAIQSTQTALTQTSGQEVKEIPKAIPDDIKRVVGNWSSIVAEAGQPLKTHLKKARLSLGGDNRLMIVVEDGLAYDYLIQEENHKHVENMISGQVGREVSVQVQSMEHGAQFEDSYVDLSKVINMDIEIEDEE
jgi:DNA polymerase-3 subunit gamma/tau